jgi:DNA-binding ferritin-like protein (Dps family)
LPFNNAETSKGDLSSSPIAEGIHVLLPKSTDGIDKKFLEKIKTIIKNGATKEIEFHETDNSDEIIIITAISAFPLRVVKRVHELEKKYNQKYKSASSDERLVDTEIHIEGGRTSYNNLLMPDSDKLTKDIVPYLWILKAFGEIQSIDENYHVIINDEDGFMVADIDIGDNFILSHEKIVSEEDFLEIQGVVERKLLELKSLIPKERKNRIDKLKEEIKSIYKEAEEFFLKTEPSKMKFFAQQAKKAISLMQ